MKCNPVQPINPTVQQQPKLLVLLVSNLENLHLLTKSNLEAIHKSVIIALKTSKNQNVKCHICQRERGRYNFICPNDDTKEFAMNIVRL